MIYTADDGGTTIQLEVLNLETGESHALTDDDQIYVDPVFSPDGSRVAYVSTKPNGYFNVYVRAFENGQWAGEEVAITEDNNYGNSRLYFGEWDMAITPTWLPGSGELLVISNRGVPLGSGNVLRIPAEEDGLLQATTVLSEQTLYRTRPDVSLDGKRFIYSSTGGTSDQFSNLYVQPTIGGEPYKMTFLDHDAFHPPLFTGWRVGSPTSRTGKDSPNWRCSRPTVASRSPCTSPIGAGGARWGCWRSGPRWRGQMK